jgi:hypothetical protein
MIELLAIPSWNTDPKTLGDWTAALSAQGHPAIVARDDDETWIEVAPLRLRGYVSLEGPHVEAINFELAEADPEPASRAIAAAALQLGWEVHPDEPEEDNVDED